MKFFSSLFLSLILTLVATVSTGKELPKIAVWDLEPLNTPPTHARNLTSILVSEVSKFNKYEVCILKFISNRGEYFQIISKARFSPWTGQNV